MRILLFDIDGTLLLTNGGGKGALHVAMTEEFGLDSVCTQVTFSGRTDRSLLAELLERNGLPDDEHHRERLGRRYIATFPEVLSDRGGVLLPGASDLLSRLAETPDIHSYAMTGNLRETAKRKLDHFDLLWQVREVFGGDFDIHRDDLARRCAGELRLRYDGELDDVIVIGDTPADIRCGHAIGARVLAVCTGSHDRSELEAESPMHVADDLSDVDRLFELLSGDDN